MSYEPSNVAKGAAEALRRVLPLEDDVPDALLEALRRLDACHRDGGDVAPVTEDPTQQA